MSLNQINSYQIVSQAAQLISESQARTCQSRKFIRGKRMDTQMMERSLRRALAPYIRIVRKGEKFNAIQETPDKILGVTGLKKKTNSLERNIAAYLNNSLDITVLLHETTDVLQLVSRSDGATLYMVNHFKGEIFNLPRTLPTLHPKVSWPIGEGTTVAAFVAFRKEYLVVEDLYHDIRFPNGLGWIDPKIKAVLTVPVVTPDEELVAVIELYKFHVNKDANNAEPFERVDLQIVVTVTGWLGAAIHQNRQRQVLQMRQDLNDCLLELTRSYFSDSISFVSLMSKVIKYSKELIGAERGSFFVVDRDAETGELVADMYDDPLDRGDELLCKKAGKIRFDSYPGVASIVARTGELVSFHDFPLDSHYCKDLDVLSSVTRSVICMPIHGHGGLLGMIQLVNKHQLAHSHFSTHDEKLLTTFACYCALCLNFARIQKRIKHQSAEIAVNSEMLGVHYKPCIHDRNRLLKSPLLDKLPYGFDKFGWYVTPYEENMAQMLYFMITDLVDCFDHKTLCVFILAVKNSYRKNPYHNYEHAFTFTHCVYNVVKRNLDIFTPSEKKSLIIAAFCHDIDHRGFTNNFMQLSNADLYQLYPESCMENHHFVTTIKVIQSTQLYSSVSAMEYRDIVDEIHDAIIATDLALYFRCRPRLINLIANGEFDWKINNHRVLIKSIMMTVGDLSGQCKPFPIAKRITESLYREFYYQGDLEKEMGLSPLSMMDRDKQHTIPTDQMRFIDIVVLPCVDLLSTVLPNTLELYTLARDLRNHWESIVEQRTKVALKSEEPK